MSSSIDVSLPLKRERVSDKPKNVQVNVEGKTPRAKAGIWKVASISENAPDFIVTFAEWFFRKESDEEDVAGQWWILRKEAAHVPITVGLFALVAFFLCYYVGLFNFMYRRGYVQDEIVFVEGRCGSCSNAVSVFEFPDDDSREWMRSIDKLKPLSAADGERGWFTLPQHWAYDGPRNVSFNNLRPIMVQESQGGQCDCGSQHGIPAAIFAYNGIAYMAHQFSGVRGAVVSCKMSGLGEDGLPRLLEVSAASTGVVRYWNSECNEVKQDASHALMCCASLCQLPPKNLLN